MHRFWNSSDRLLLTLVIAAVVHAIVILGVTFSMPDPERHRSSLEITLVRSFTRDVPEDAEFLAQENQTGGGSNPERAIPHSEPVLPSGVGRELNPAPNQSRLAEVMPKSVLEQDVAEKKISPQQGSSDEPESATPRLSADAMPQPVTEISTQINRSKEDSAHDLRTVDINEVRTRKDVAVAYQRAWQDRIEHVGTLNFPDEARRRRLSGSLLMSVALRADGSITSIRIKQSSGHRILDDAARNIVQLAGPYPPFPAELAQQADVLVITRTWKFFTDHRLETVP